MTATTDAERKAAERARNRARGLTEVIVWVPEHRKEELRRIAARMREEAEDDVATD